MTPKKILLTEDDSDDRIFFHDFLEDRKDLLLLPAVENGEDLMGALETIEEANLPDAIILDQNMPKLNGLQTLTLLKSHIRYSDIPVMVYSTYTDDALIEHCMETGATIVVPKPADKAGYYKMMDEFLKVID